MSTKSYSNRMILRIIFLFFYTSSIYVLRQSHAAATVSANQTLSMDQNTVASDVGVSTLGDTISTNQSLRGNQTLISSGGNFELGIFTPGNSSKYYVGIWFKKVWKQTVVWVANRDTPILDKNSPQLKVLDGNLVLLNESNYMIWSTNLNLKTPTNLAIAVLLDDGNLVLKENEGSIGTLWESFDNPTDSWMPGAKFGYNKRLQKKQVPSCWKSSEDPGTGLFSMEFDPNEIQFIAMWNRSKQYWTSGSWNNQTFNLVPEMRMSFGKYNVSYVDNENETYFMYSPNDPSVFTRLFMDSSGQMKHETWTDNTSWNLFFSQPRQQCEVYAYCGAFSMCNENSLPFCSCLPGFKITSDSDWSLKDYSSGCVREMSLECESNGTNSSGRKDRFVKNSNVRLPENSHPLMIRSMDGCESACLSNCSCKAYAYDENGCFVWSGNLLNVQQLAQGDGGGRTIYIRLSASSPMFFRSKKDNKGHVVGAIAGGSLAFVLALVAIVAFLIIRYRRERGGTFNAIHEGFLVPFRYKDLQTATKNFSDKLGGGGFGSVFRGILPDASVIAVKKLESINQGEKQFRTEVSTIGIIQHVNLVRLRGFCTEGNKKLLVYDYMENGSLDSHLFNPKESNVLKWNIRYQIALGIAKGLAYLHENCEDCIIHCDIKPENILLDAELHPKVADFGLAKLVGRDFSRVLTTMRGTIGYLAPEWLSGVAVTAKADVYSYGMILLELVSGKRNWRESEDETVAFFPYLAAKVIIEGGDVLDLLDPILEGEANIEEVLRICKLACWCIQGHENIRPSIGQAVQILEGIIDVNLPPIPRWLQALVENQDPI